MGEGVIGAAVTGARVGLSDGTTVVGMAEGSGPSLGVEVI